MTDLLPVRDLTFLLFDVFGMDDILSAETFSSHDQQGLVDILEMARQMSLQEFAPIAAALDAEEPTLVDGKVRLHPAAKPALDTFIEAGFLSAPFDEDIGGLQVPFVIHEAITALFGATNTPLLAYAGLTIAAANLLATHGSEALKETWLRPLVEGRFFGTMALSEPQAGSSLADLLTVAVPASDGTYRVRGSKMWITGADQDISENIVHLVLARLPDAPAGTRGISLFLVPKLLPDADGGFTIPNDVAVVGINHKMGFRGAVNTVFSLGDNGGAVGFLVGEPHRGLHAMFHMMNEARIGVGLCAACLSWAGYRHALAYARERPQGRRISERNPLSPPVPIIAHADVRRLLLEQKAISEGALALVMYASLLVDRQRIARESGAEDRAREIGLLLDTLTPIVKAWSSEHGLRASSSAIQVLGGYGYTREYPVERLYRDNRLNPIHEGTNGIQAIDLLGRKILGKGGGAVLLPKLQDVVSRGQAAGGRCAELAEGLAEAVGLLTEVTMSLAGVATSQGPEVLLANATPYLHLVGHTVIAWMWLEQAIIAQAQLAAESPEADFLHGKLQAAQYFFRWELPKTATWAKVLIPVDRTCLDTDPAWL
ncbi:MAG: acyl-CoA dehydrogenase [Myxococcota bacterium]|nr:acyl-CoA dehydrogenase [Myxococcota bacterium]